MGHLCFGKKLMSFFKRMLNASFRAVLTIAAPSNGATAEAMGFVGFGERESSLRHGNS